MKLPVCRVSADHAVVLIPGTEVYRCVECDNVVCRGMPKTSAMRMQEEVENVLRRYSFEDDISVFEALGVFRICELNLIDRLKEANKK